MAQITGAVQSMELFTIGEVKMVYAYANALFDGVTSVSVDISLPRNALVDDYRFLIQARRVDSTKVQEVAQVRSYSSAGGHELVIDFGTPRTISGIDLDVAIGAVALNVLAVHVWLGSQFSPNTAYEKTAATATASALFAELRTERVRVIVSREPSNTEIANVRLRLPEPPSGLDIRIDGAPPVWAHPEPVQPRANVDAADTQGWDKNSQRIVDLSTAVAALAGDPMAGEDAVSFKVTLTTQVPCELDIDVHGTPQLRRIRRVRLNGDTAVALAFSSEGLMKLPLRLPAPPAGQGRRIDQLRWFAVADLPPQRVLPPIGPDPASTSNEPVLAELLVDPQRAVCVRLPGGSGLAELTGIRLPLRTTGDGAELRIVLWSVTALSSMPAAPLRQGSSEPVTLAASGTGTGTGTDTGTNAEAWVTFTFKQAVPIDSALMPWMALIVARGEVSWSLARCVAGDALESQVVRRGPPNGPWKALPTPLQNAGDVLDARARLRLVGIAPKETPLAPLTIALAGAPASDLTPTAKGVPGVLTLSPGLNVAQPELHLVSRTSGSLQLRDIDIISNN